MIHLEQRQLIPQACFALAERVDPTAHRCHALTEIEVEPLHKGGIDRPTTRRSDLLDGQPGAEHHAVGAPDDTPTLV